MLDIFDFESRKIVKNALGQLRIKIANDLYMQGYISIPITALS